MEHNNGNKSSIYAKGPVYQVRVYLKSGMILTATPMTGEKSRELFNLLTEAIGSHVEGVDCPCIDSTQAHTRLLEDAALWEQNAVFLEDKLLKNHTPILENVEKAWHAAAYLKDQAKSLPEK